MKKDDVVIAAMTEGRDFLKRMLECLTDVGAPENTIELATKDEPLMRHLAKEWVNTLLPPAHGIQTQKESLEQILTRIVGRNGKTILTCRRFAQYDSSFPEPYEVASALSERVIWDFRPSRLVVQPLLIHRRTDFESVAATIARRGFAFCDLKTFLTCVADHVPTLYMPFHRSYGGYQYMRTIAPTKDGDFIRASFLVTINNGTCHHLTLERGANENLSSNDMLLVVPAPIALPFSK